MEGRDARSRESSVLVSQDSNWCHGKLRTLEISDTLWCLTAGVPTADPDSISQITRTRSSRARDGLWLVAEQCRVSRGAMDSIVHMATL